MRPKKPANLNAGRRPKEEQTSGHAGRNDSPTSRGLELFTAVKAFFLDLVFPKQCLGCSKEGILLCASCSSALTFKTPSCPVCSFRNGNGLVCASCRRHLDVRRLIAPFSYRDELVRELIHAYKYEGVYEIADLLANQVFSFFSRFHLKIPRRTVIIPIPLHRARWRQRGFNQAELLARKIGAGLNLFVTPKALTRIRATDPQTELDSFYNRRANVRGVFRVRRPDEIYGKTVLLVDDVSTSGATLHEASRALRRAGARSVSAIVIAKG